MWWRGGCGGGEEEVNKRWAIFVVGKNGRMEGREKGNDWRRKRLEGKEDREERGGGGRSKACPAV